MGKTLHHIAALIFNKKHIKFTASVFIPWGQTGITVFCGPETVLQFPSEEKQNKALFQVQ